jgi:hypothetical protein
LWLSVFGRLAQLVARFLHTEEVIGSSPVSPTVTMTAVGNGEASPAGSPSATGVNIRIRLCPITPSWFTQHPRWRA